MTRLARDVYLKSGRRAGDAVLTAGKGGGDEEEAGSRGKRRGNAADPAGDTSRKSEVFRYRRKNRPSVSMSKNKSFSPEWG